MKNELNKNCFESDITKAFFGEGVHLDMISYLKLIDFLNKVDTLAEKELAFSLGLHIRYYRDHKQWSALDMHIDSLKHDIRMVQARLRTITDQNNKKAVGN